MSWLRRGLIVAVLWGIGCERLPSNHVPFASSPSASKEMATQPPVAAPVVPQPEPAPPIPVGQLELAQAQQLVAEGKLAEARILLQPIADLPECPSDVRDLIGEINTRILFSPAPDPRKTEYTVVAGDTLGKIAARFNSPIALIKKSNQLTSDTIRVGQRLRIYQGEFAVAVSKSANTLVVTDRGHFFKHYRVGTGEHRKTPVGEFKIINRQEHPVWYRGDKEIPYGDPENILGTHWLGLDIAGFGLHGTWDNDSLGKQSTAGCIRLSNDDIAELYAMLPLGTPVAIRE